MTSSPNCRCPVCGGKADDATPATEAGAIPALGDVAVCAYCRAVLVYDGEPLRLRLPMGSERAELYGDEGIARARRMILQSAPSRAKYRVAS